MQGFDKFNDIALEAYAYYHEGVWSIRISAPKFLIDEMTQRGVRIAGGGTHIDTREHHVDIKFDVVDRNVRK